VLPQFLPYQRFTAHRSAADLRAGKVSHGMQALDEDRRRKAVYRNSTSAHSIAKCGRTTPQTDSEAYSKPYRATT
jgi:hypothetical protein